MSSRLALDARDTIKWAGVSIAGYIRHYSINEEWRGDSCGCVDDRCAGYHHDAGEECGCLEACIAEMLRDQARDRVLADVAFLRREYSTPVTSTGFSSFGLEDLEQLRDTFATAAKKLRDIRQRLGWADADPMASADADSECRAEVATGSTLPRKSQ